MAFSDVRKEMDCSVCLNIYTDPVILKCGHNFCRDCIDGVLSTQEGSGGYCCPECREEFQERPELTRNITLRNIVENFRSAEPEEKASPIFCTYCFHSPVPAVTSCLLCEASLCENHVRVHSKSSQHVLSELTSHPESRKCSVHKKILEHYCTEDSACLCGSCRLHGDHQEHRVETLEEASEKRKENLTNALQELLKKREEMEQSIESLQKYKRKVRNGAAGLTKRATSLFRDLRRHLETLERRVLNEISRQAEKESFPASDLIQELEIKRNEVAGKIRHLEEVCNMKDPLTVLQESDTGDLCDTEGGDEKDKQRLGKLLHGGGDLDMTAILQTLHTGISDIVTGVYGGIYVLEPAYLLLDVDTAHNCLRISDDKKTAHRVTKPLNYVATPSRFQGITAERVAVTQVLSCQSFSSGRHYWDVDVGRSEYWTVGMCYPSIDRAGHYTDIGYNRVSWGLDRNSNQLSGKENRKSTSLSGNFLITRVRVYLDYEAGQISFYELGIPMRHLHTFTTTFTQPLHAVLNVQNGYIKICRGDTEV